MSTRTADAFTAKPWPKVSLGELLRLERRPVKVEADGSYPEIGIYCFGRGIFHKLPRTGLEVGDKDLFLLKENDFILQVTFAWEGAVAIVSKAEEGMFGSTRYPTFRVDESRCFPKFLLNYFKTREGLQQLINICPGSAGRNRVLSIKRIPEVLVPLPPLPEQRRIVVRIEELATQIQEARALRELASKEGKVLTASAVHKFAQSSSKAAIKLLDLVGQDGLRNGKSVKSLGSESETRCLTLSSMRNGRIDTRESKTVPIPRSEAMAFHVRKGDVFIVRGNGSKELCGKAGLVENDPIDTIFPDLFIKPALPKDRVNSDYFVMIWNSPLIRGVIEEKAKTTSGIWKINQGHILSTEIPLPPLAEQLRIVTELNALQAQVDALRKLQDETSAELDALLPSILDKAFKGEL